jgi:hypothetical protein
MENIIIKNAGNYRQVETLNRNTTGPVVRHPFSLYFSIIPPTTDKPLDAKHGILGICNRLSLG